MFSTRSNLDPTVSRDIGSDSLRAQPFDDFFVYIFPRPLADAATVNFFIENLRFQESLNDVMAFMVKG